MNLIICDNAKEMSEKAAALFADRIKNNPAIVLGLATGRTPVGMYKEFIRLHQAGSLDFSQVTTYNLDEYLGLAGDHPQSYQHFMRDSLFNYININPQRNYFLNGGTADPIKECADFEKLIKQSGGIDLQLLGIGVNGHIAFNEPGASFDSRTGIIKLAEETIKSNSRYFDSAEQVPRESLSMGIGTIMEAKEIVMLADGEAKADAIAKAIEGPVTTDVPASILQNHPNCTFIIDRAAASLLKKSN